MNQIHDLFAENDTMEAVEGNPEVDRNFTMTLDFSPIFSELNRMVFGPTFSPPPSLRPIDRVSNDVNMSSPDITQWIGKQTDADRQIPEIKLDVKKDGKNVTDQGQTGDKTLRGGRSIMRKLGRETRSDHGDQKKFGEVKAANRPHGNWVSQKTLLGVVTRSPSVLVSKLTTPSRPADVFSTTVAPVRTGSIPRPEILTTPMPIRLSVATTSALPNRPTVDSETLIAMKSTTWATTSQETRSDFVSRNGQDRANLTNTREVASVEPSTKAEVSTMQQPEDRMTYLIYATLMTLLICFGALLASVVTYLIYRFVTRVKREKSLIFTLSSFLPCQNRTDRL